MGIINMERTVDNSTLLVAKATSPLYYWLKMADTEATGIAKLMMSTFSRRENSPAQSLTISRVITGAIISFTKQTT